MFSQEVQQKETNLEKKIFEEDEFANWETYRNREYNFEIKYPDDWILVFRERPYPEVDSFFGFRRKEIIPAADDYMDILVMIMEQKQPIDYSIKDESSGFVWRITDGEKISVSGMDAYYLKNVDAPILGVDEVYFAYKKNLYRIRVIPFEEENEEHRVVFNKIISTFRFLD